MSRRSVATSRLTHSLSLSLSDAAPLSLSLLQLISELPTSIQLNITNVTAKSYLKRVRVLNSLPDYFLSTLSIELQVSCSSLLFLPLLCRQKPSSLETR
jgi:hypothetical protein